MTTHQKSIHQQTSTDIKMLPDPNDYLKDLLTTIPSLQSHYFM